MIWPPVKAWTSRFKISDKRHFVAINYGGTLLDRWVILISVLDSDVLVKVPWSELIDPVRWNCGWDENNLPDIPEFVDNKTKNVSNNCRHLSIDSGLTIPITSKKIRSWFDD